MCARILSVMVTLDKLHAHKTIVYVKRRVPYINIGQTSYLQAPSLLSRGGSVDHIYFGIPKKWKDVHGICNVAPCIFHLFHSSQKNVFATNFNLRATVEPA